MVSLLSFSCSAEKRGEVPPDCAISDRYEFKSLMATLGTETYFYPVPDWTPAPKSITSEEPPSPPHVVGQAYLVDGVPYQVKLDTRGVRRVFYSVSYLPDPAAPDVCGNARVMTFTTMGNQNWGSFTSHWQPLSEVERSATGYDGFSFWARSEFDAGLQLAFTDAYSDSKPVPAPTAVPYDTVRKCEPKVLDGEFGEDLPTQVVNPKYYDQNGVPTPEACDNEYTTEVLTTHRWAFYKVPFTHLTQTPDPRLRPEGIERDAIFRLRIRALKDSTIKTHFAGFAWYREATP
jgi:hypothetical protein